MTFARSDPDAETLIVTNMWPRESAPALGIFVKRQVGSLVRAGLKCDVLVIHGHRSPLAYPVAALFLLWWSLTRRRRYRLVHAHSGEAALAARFYLRGSHVATYCGSDLLGVPQATGGRTRRSLLRARIIRHHSRTFAATITQSREMAERLPKSVRRRNSVISYGIDFELFTPHERGEAREALGWVGEHPVALFVANPSVAIKRYWLAEAAWERARVTAETLELVVTHGNRYTEGQVALLMSAADCLLLTSASEGSPNVVKEALACNLPVVTTPVGDVDELLFGVENSAICDPTPAALAQALVDTIGVGSRSNGRSQIRYLELNAVARKLASLYERVSGIRISAVDAEEPARVGTEV